MSKRSRTKGRGVDVYLGGHSETPSNSQRVASATAQQLSNADSEKIFESLAKLEESVCGLLCAKKVAAWFIEANEKLANQAIELHQESMNWIRKTGLAPLFNAQISIAQQVVECSASAARNLWRITP